MCPAMSRVKSSYQPLFQNPERSSGSSQCLSNQSSASLIRRRVRLARLFGNVRPDASAWDADWLGSQSCGVARAEVTVCSCPATSHRSAGVNPVDHCGFEVLSWDYEQVQAQMRGQRPPDGM
jgi:hypothetical protein